MTCIVYKTAIKTPGHFWLLIGNVIGAETQVHLAPENHFARVSGKKER